MVRCAGIWISDMMAIQCNHRVIACEAGFRKGTNNGTGQSIGAVGGPTSNMKSFRRNPPEGEAAGGGGEGSMTGSYRILRTTQPPLQLPPAPLGSTSGAGLIDGLID